MSISLEKFIKNIEKVIFKSNQKFEKATLAEKRVMVLQDALLQIRRKRFIAKRGTYFDLDLEQIGPWDLSIALVGEHQLSSVIAQPGARCSVCAIGGAFASLVRLHDKMLLEEIPLKDAHFRDLEDYVVHVFPKPLLCGMEAAFEYGDYGYKRTLLPSSLQALRAIYNNIISNEGKRFTTYAVYSTPPVPKGKVIWEE